MRPLATAILLAALAEPLAAQTPESPEDGADEGLSLMERGAQMFMEGILREMEPALDDLQGLADELGPALRGFATEMGPALRDLLEEIEDWSLYHPPEILDNGDIIIRRKTPKTTEEGGDQIEL